MVDEALRAWLRWYRSILNRTDDDDLTERLSDRETEAYDALSSKQKSLLGQTLKSNGGRIAVVMKLYGHEAEFQNGTQSE